MKYVRELSQEERREIRGGFIRPNWTVAILELYVKSFNYGRKLYHLGCEHD